MVQTFVHVEWQKSPSTSALRPGDPHVFDEEDTNRNLPSFVLCSRIYQRVVFGPLVNELRPVIVLPFSIRA